MKTKLNELLEFPTPFTYKVMGQALPELVDQVVEVVQRLNHLQHLSTRVGQDQAFAMALKQRHPQLRFQMADMAGQRRLRDK